MSDHKLDIAFWNYDRMRALADGTVKIDGVDASFHTARAVTKLGLNGAMLFGRTRDRNLEHPDFLPIFEAAAALNAPLYLHPQTSLPSVRAAYYSGFGDAVDDACR